MAETIPTQDPPKPDTPTPPAANPPIDLEAIKASAVADAQKAFAAQLKDATGFDSFESLKADQLKSEGKLQELADTHAASAQQWRAKYQQSTINTALLSAATEAVDPAVVAQLLAGRCACDDDGKVTVDGKPVTEAVTALLNDKPFLAKAQGGAGSGTPAAASKQPVAEPSDPSPIERLKRARKGA